MPNYLCHGVNSAGKASTLEIEAGSAIAARRQLIRQGITVLQLEAASDRPVRLWRMRRGRKFDLFRFSCRLSPLLDAGIPLEKSLAVIETHGGDCGDDELVRSLRKGLHEGKKFSTMTREHPDCFPPIYSSLIETGEEAGCLPEVVRELRRYLKESKEFREFLITSSIYPAIVISVTLLVVVLLFVVFIPRFAKIFAELGREMPLLTRIMLDIGNFMQSTWWIGLLLLGGGMLLWKKLYQKTEVRDRLDAGILHLPILGKIIYTVQVSRFIRTLAIMVRNNVHLLTAIRIAGRVIANRAVAAAFFPLEDALRRGMPLSEILGSNPFMPQGSAAMLKIAEESGDLGEMLARIATESEENTRIRLRRLLALFEPVVILVLAFVVLLVVLSVFLAIMDMNVIK